MRDDVPIPSRCHLLFHVVLFLIARPFCPLQAVRTRMIFTGTSIGILQYNTMHWVFTSAHRPSGSWRVHMYLILIMQNVYLALRMYTFGANQCSLIVFLNLESFEHLRLQLISFRIYSPLYLNKSRPASQSESHVLSLSDVVLCNIQSSMEFGRTQPVFRVMPHLVDHGLLSLYAQQ